MPPPLIVSLLVLVSLPMVPWASHLTFDLVPEAGDLAPGPTVPASVTRPPDGVSITRDHTGVTLYFDNNAYNIDRPFQMTYAMALGVPGSVSYSTNPETDLHSGYVWDFTPDDGGTLGTDELAGAATREMFHALGFLSGVDQLDTYSVPKNGLPRYASTAYVIEMLDLFRYCGPSTSAGVMDFSDAGGAGHGKSDPGMGSVNPGAAAGPWLRVGAGGIVPLDAIGRNMLETAAGPDGLALCLIGLVAIVSSLLLRRCEIGGKHAGHSRRFQTGRYRIT